MNTITLGSYTFTDSDLISGSIIMEHSVIGESLAADTMKFTVDVPSSFNPDEIEYATTSVYYVNGERYGTFYFTNCERLGKTKYKISCTSAVGLLIDSEHLGGIYEGVLASTIIADILSNISYTLDASFSSTTVRGYLPVATRRDNLQQVLFAIGGAVRIDGVGGFEIIPMSPSVVSSISAERTYMGGSVKTGKVYSGVELTEHNYFVSGEVETLYNDSITSEQTITFKEPHHSFAITGGTIVASGANYCRVKPTGTASTITLTGKKYVHTQRVIEANDGESNGSIMSIKGAYLANPEIADALAKRVWKFAKCNTYIKQDIVVGSEKSGDIVEVINPYTDETEEAVMTSMGITLSGTNKAQCEFLLGFEPEGVISGYQHYAMMTGAATWQKSSNNMSITPTDGTLIIDGVEKSGTQSLGNVDKFRMILVGGGGGGGNGESGSNASDASVSFTRYSTWNSQGSGYHVKDVSYSPGVGGAGGRGGVGGQGGKVFELSITPQNGDSGAISIGGGGSGGSTPSAGAESTLSVNSVAYSSGMGKLYPYGYVEPKTGLAVAICGTDGISGASGGNGGAGGQGDVQGNGYNGESTSLFSGGNGASKHNEYQSKGDRGPYYHWYYGGGGGGGASGKAVGGNGSSYNGGNGANGGNAPLTTHYGEGGCGGYGGGGGGGAAMMYYSKNSLSSWDENCYTGTSGQGGSGGTGASGKGGVIFIYY